MRDATIADLRRLLADAKSARAEFEPAWFLNLAFFEGRQWVYWNGASSRLMTPSLDESRVRIVDNRIAPVIRTEAAKLSKYRPTYQCTPHSGDQDDLSAANLSESVLSFLWDHLDMPDRYERALLWSRAAGAGFLKILWDRTLGDAADAYVNGSGDLIVDPVTRRPLQLPAGADLSTIAQAMGQPPDAVRRVQVNQGDIRIVVRSPFEIYPDPLAETFQDLEWLIEETVQSQEQVRQRYGVVLPTDAPANPGMVQSSLGGMRSRSSYRGVRVYEYWRKPCADYPQGCRRVWAGEQMLEEDPAPVDAMPYVMLRGIDVPGRFWPTSVAEQLRPLQVELNKVKSQLAENRNRVGNATLAVAEGAVEDKDEFERQVAQPGGVVYYRTSVQGAVPTYIQPPQLPAYLMQEIDRIESAIQEIAGQHEVTAAQVPAGVTAASAINLLQEADDTRLGPAVAALERALAACGRKQLDLVARFYDDQRTIAIVADDDAWQLTPFRGAMLRGHTKVDVQAGSIFPRSQAAKQAAMESLLNLFIQNGQAFKRQDLARFLKAYNVGGVEFLIASEGVDQSQIGRENRQLAQGVALEINAYDDDDAHIAGHEDWQKTTEYDQLPAATKATTEAHVQRHRARLDAAQQAAQQQQAPTGAPGPAPAAPAAPLAA